MRYVSTRGEGGRPSFVEAVSEGLAPDGGLFVPESLPDISAKLSGWEKLDYPELCFEFLSLFADGVPEADLRRIVRASYGKFDTPEIAPLKKIDGGLWLLELFHGPTLAFKDFALQLLGNLYEYILELGGGRKINVLGATSGDTGSAAIHGLLGKRNVNIFILYPHGRISPLQERQMACTGAANVFPVAIDGTFDDAQAIVKELFGDAKFKADYALSAVNSINIARILAQCVYYIWASLRLPAAERDGAQFIVPTGNFGNVLAGWLAWKMGMPAAGFKVATNSNDILHRFFSTGVYEVRGPAIQTCAPSMDIQVASNFERFIYYMEGGDSERVRRAMRTFAERGKWTFEGFDAGVFSSSRMDDALIAEKIAEVYKKSGEVIDPHTACAFADLSWEGAKVAVSTAHPAKFPELVGRVLGFAAKSGSLDALMDRRLRRAHLPADAEAVRKFIAENSAG